MNPDSAYAATHALIALAIIFGLIAAMVVPMAVIAWRTNGKQDEKCTDVLLCKDCAAFCDGSRDHTGHNVVPYTSDMTL